MQSLRRMRRFWSRIVGTFSDDVDAELREELEAHLEMHVAENVRRGMSPDEARREALIASGGTTAGAEAAREQRRLPMIDAVAADARFALRSIRGHARLYALSTVATIALGVGADSAVFTLVDAVLFRPLPFPSSDRVVDIWNSFPGFHIAIAGQAPGSLDAFRRYNHTLDAIGVVSEGAASISSDDGSLAPAREPFAAISGVLFPVLGAHAIVGRTLDASDTISGGIRPASGGRPRVL